MSTETGWTRDSPKVDGIYWWRADADDPEPDIHQVAGGSFFEPGHRAAETVEDYGGEWLGPISPSDFEQLIRLRRLASDAADLLDVVSSHLENGYMKQVAREHREALAHREGEKS